ARGLAVGRLAPDPGAGDPHPAEAQTMDGRAVGAEPEGASEVAHPGRIPEFLRTIPCETATSGVVLRPCEQMGSTTRRIAAAVALGLALFAAVPALADAARPPKLRLLWLDCWPRACGRAPAVTDRTQLAVAALG